MIGFNKPYITGKEFEYIQEAIKIEKLSGNGFFTKRCHEYFEKRYGFKKCLLTHSCTAALEMAALLLDIQSGDEVIMPSYTFVSTANAFLLRGATIVFADSNERNPNIDVNHIRKLVTPRTRAVVVVHYAGVSCDMDPLLELAREKNFFIVEDAAQAIDSSYDGRPLGSIGHLAAFSFHETKNIIAGEGGMLVINDDRFAERSEIIWEKGTNRAAFFRREVSKYTWVDLGSSYLPSEITAAFLLAQLENLDRIQDRRKNIWERYRSHLLPLAQKGKIQLPYIDELATNNAHIFYILANNLQERNDLLEYLKHLGVQAIFHYLPLHDSPYFKKVGSSGSLPHAERYGNCLIRLPLFYELPDAKVTYVCDTINSFFDERERVGA